MVPTSSDNVTITSGCTVTIDTAAAAYSVTVNSGGVLQYEDATARTLTSGGNVTINAPAAPCRLPRPAQWGRMCSRSAAT